MKLNEKEKDAVFEAKQSKSACLKVIEIAIRKMEADLLACPPQAEQLLAARLHLEGARKTLSHAAALLADSKRDA